MNRSYIAYYKGEKIAIEAPTSYAAQKLAAEKFGVKQNKSYLVAVVLVDVPVDPASL